MVEAQSRALLLQADLAAETDPAKKAAIQKKYRYVYKECQSLGKGR